MRFVFDQIRCRPSRSCLPSFFKSGKALVAGSQATAETSLRISAPTSTGQAFGQLLLSQSPFLMLGKRRPETCSRAEILPSCSKAEPGQRRLFLIFYGANRATGCVIRGSR